MNSIKPAARTARVPLLIVGLALTVAGRSTHQSGSLALTIVGVVFLLLAVAGTLAFNRPASDEDQVAASTHSM